jgi:hypothetical protein
MSYPKHDRTTSRFIDAETPRLLSGTMHNRRRFLAVLSAFSASAIAASAPLSWKIEHADAVPAAQSADLADSLNLLANPGFEEVAGGMPTGWMALPGTPAGSIVSTTVQARSGQSSVLLDDQSSTTSVGLRSDPVSIDVGALYHASVYALVTSGAAQLYLEFWDAAQTRVGVHYATSASTATWTQLTVEATAPANSVSATVMAYTPLGNVGSAYYDDALLAAGPPNLLENPSFEDISDGVPAGWSVIPAAPPGSVASSTSLVRSGLRSVLLSDESSTTGTGLRSTPVAVSGGSLYHASIYAHPDSGAGQMYLEFWDDSGTRIDTKVVTTATVGEWTQLSVECFAPDAASTATVLAYLSAGNVGTVYYDDARFADGPASPTRDFPLLISGHPRLYFTSADHADILARTMDPTPTPIGPSPQGLWSNVIAAADTYLTQQSFTIAYTTDVSVTYALPPVQPPPHDPPAGYTSYPFWTQMSRQIETRLDILALAAFVTGSQDYIDRATEFLMALVAWDTWSEPAYAGGVASLDTASLTLTSAFAYDVLYDSLTPADRAAAATGIEQLGARSIYSDFSTLVDNNLTMAVMAALGSAGAVLLGTSDNANAYLTKATDAFTWWLGRRDTSGTQEGHTYTSLSTDDILKVSDQIYRVTGVRDVLDDEYFNEAVGGDAEHAAHLMQWILYSLAPGGSGLAPISDSGATNYYFFTSAILAATGGDGHAGWYLSAARPIDSPASEFLYAIPGTSSVPPTDLPASAAMQPIGQAALRSGWDSGDVALILVSGASNLYHNHYDQNSFLVGTDGVWIASDPGYQEYVAGAAHDFTTTYGHSTIYVDGQAQNVKGGGQLHQGVISPAGDYVRGDAASAYQDPVLTTFDRRIAFVPPYYWVMFDDVSSPDDHVYSWRLYTGGEASYTVDGVAVEPQVGGSGAVNGSVVWVSERTAQLAVSFVRPGPLPIAVELYDGAESYGPYFTASTMGASKDAQFVTVIQAAPYIRPGVTEGVAAFDPGQSSGADYKPVVISGSTLLFYKALTEGAYAAFDIEVSESGQYTAYIQYGRSPAYGQVQCFIDGVSLGSIFDGYDASVTLPPTTALGSVALTAGAHELTVMVTGQNASSSGAYFSVAYIQLVPDGQEPTPPPLVAATSTPVESSNALGVSIQRPGQSAITDLVLFSTGSGITGHGVDSDATQVTIGIRDDGTIERYAAADTTVTTYGGQMLLSSPIPMAMGLLHDENAQEEVGSITLGSAATITIFSALGTTVTLDGAVLSGSDYHYDSGTRQLTLNDLAAGTHQLTIT